MDAGSHAIHPKSIDSDVCADRVFVAAALHDHRTGLAFGGNRPASGAQAYFFRFRRILAGQPDSAVDSRLTIPAWVLHPAAWQFLFVLGAGTRFYSDRLRKFALSRLAIGAAAAIVAGSVSLISLPLLHRIVPLMPQLHGVPMGSAGKDHLAFYRLLHFLALAVVVYAWAHGRPCNRGLPNWQWPAAGTRSLFIPGLSFWMSQRTWLWR